MEEGADENASSLLDESTQSNSVLVNMESKFSDQSYFLTMDPSQDEIFSIRDLREESYVQK